MSTPPPPPPNAPAAAAPKPKPNPAFAAMGMPSLRAKLPSRNWSIFWSVCAVIAGTVSYDRYRTSQVKTKWVSAVSYLGLQPLSPMALPRRVTVYLVAPPGDGITAAREHFRDYVKPVLNAAGVDFEVVEGRKMGELRFAVAERVRARRRGEEEEGEIEEFRKRVGCVRVEEGGAVVVGRHAWKEYMRGIHEGWLGPLEAPPPPPQEAAPPGVESIEDAIKEKKEEGEVEGEKDKKKEEERKREELLRPEEYASATLPRDIPAVLDAVGVVRFPHILGFLNTPIRMYRFVNRRKMAEEVCREAAAVAFGFHRQFESVASGEEMHQEGEGGEKRKQLGEIHALEFEEKDWPAKVWKEERYQGEWSEALAVDERITEKLRRFYVPYDLEPKDPKKEEQ